MTTFTATIQGIADTWAERLPDLPAHTLRKLMTDDGLLVDRRGDVVSWEYADAAFAVVWLEPIVDGHLVVWSGSFTDHMVHVELPWETLTVLSETLAATIEEGSL